MDTDEIALFARVRLFAPIKITICLPFGHCLCLIGERQNRRASTDDGDDASNAAAHCEDYISINALATVYVRGHCEIGLISHYSERLDVFIRETRCRLSAI